MPPVTQPSPAFVLNWDFKPELKPFVIVSDDDELALLFQYKPYPTQQIDQYAVRAKPRKQFEDYPVYKTTVVNLKKRKSEKDLEKDKDEKYEVFKGKFFYFQFFLLSFLLIQITWRTDGSICTAKTVASNAKHSTKRERARRISAQNRTNHTNRANYLAKRNGKINKPFNQHNNLFHVDIDALEREVNQLAQRHRHFIPEYFGWEHKSYFESQWIRGPLATGLDVFYAKGNPNRN